MLRGSPAPSRTSMRPAGPRSWEALLARAARPLAMTVARCGATKMSSDGAANASGSSRLR
eukprot:1209697-Pyramimonas_sp.AAC.1